MQEKTLHDMGPFSTMSNRTQAARVFMKKYSEKRESGKAIAYIRVSTGKQVDEGLSLEAQTHRIESYCSMNDIELVETIEDPAVSAAKSPLDKRKGGRRLIELLTESEEFGHVVGLKLDRLFRSTIDCIKNVAVWDELGITLHLIDLGGASIQTGTPMGRFFLTLMAAVAEWEAAAIGERTRIAMAEKRDRGEDLGKAPYGLRWVPKDDNNPTGYLEEDEDEQEIIQLIRHYNTVGQGIRKITRRLNEDEIPSRGKKWHHTTVARILRRIKKGE